MPKKSKQPVSFISKRAAAVMAAAALFLLVAAVAAIGIGSVFIAPGQVINVLLGQSVPGSVENVIVLNMRLPRIIGSVFGGAGLALAGLLLQILFRNPIADPYIIGISSGARMFVGFILLGGATFGFASVGNPWFLFLGAFGGACAAMIVMLLFARRIQSVTTLLIVGMMIGYFCNGVVNTLVVFSDDNQIADFTRWNLGSFGLLSWEKLMVIVIVCGTMFLAAFLLSKNLNMLRLGEEYAQTMGVEPRQMRLALIIIAGLLTAVITAFCGLISFVGMSVPHVARLLMKTSDHRALIPAVILLGGLFGVFCDLLARTIAAPGELPVGIITSFIGVPLVLFLLCRENGGKA